MVLGGYQRYTGCSIAGVMMARFLTCSTSLRTETVELTDASTMEADCLDTPSWDNSFGFACTSISKSDNHSYASRGWCSKGAIVAKYRWTSGSKYNYPERHCCVCGKLRGEVTAPSTSIAVDATPRQPDEEHSAIYKQSSETLTQPLATELAHRCHEGTWVQHRGPNNDDVCQDPQGIESCPSGCGPSNGADGLHCFELATGRKCRIEEAIIDEHMSDFSYVGCFANSGDLRMTHHKLDHTLDECATLASAEKRTYFGLEYPQGSKHGSHKAACLVLDGYPQMERTVDDNCEAEVFRGYRLGSGMRIAVYTFKEGGKGAFVLQHSGGKYVCLENGPLVEHNPHLVLSHGCERESRFSKLHLYGSGFFVLQHCSGNCVHAQSINSSPKDGVYLALYECNVRDRSFHFKQISVAEDGSSIIQHRSTGMCIQPERNFNLSLHIGCQNSSRDLYFRMAKPEIEADTCVTNGTGSISPGAFPTSHEIIATTDSAKGTAASLSWKNMLDSLKGVFILETYDGKCIAIQREYCNDCGPTHLTKQVSMLMVSICSTDGRLPDGLTPHWTAVSLTTAGAYFVLKHSGGGCVAPAGGEAQPANDEPLVLADNCSHSNALLFKVLPGREGYFALQHSSGMCVHILDRGQNDSVTAVPIPERRDDLGRKLELLEGRSNGSQLALHRDCELIPSFGLFFARAPSEVWEKLYLSSLLSRGEEILPSATAERLVNISPKFVREGIRIGLESNVSQFYAAHHSQIMKPRDNEAEKALETHIAASFVQTSARAAGVDDDHETNTLSLHSCSCVVHGPVFLVSHRGEHLRSTERDGVHMSQSYEGPGAHWNIVGVGDGKFVLTNDLSLTLQHSASQDQGHTLVAPFVAKPSLWEQWTLLSDASNGQSCTEVIITSHRNQYLQDHHGVPRLSGNPGAWERWKLVAPNGGPPCGVSQFEQTASVRLQDCPTFYQAAEGVDQGQDDIRHATVWEMMNRYPHLRKMSSIYYTRDWDVLKNMFRASRLPVNLTTMGDCCTHKKHTKGQIAKWATLLLGAAWQVRFKQPCMVLFEDDVRLPSNFRNRIATLVQRLPTHEPKMLKFGRFAEGYVFNLKAADLFLRRVYERGIDEWCDLWTDRELKGHLQQVDIGISLAVHTGGGNIWKTVSAEETDFDYSMSHDSAHAQILSGAFKPDDESAKRVDLVTTALQVARSQLTL